MAGDELKYSGRRLAEWMRGIRDGLIALPTFQRSSVWDIGKVRNLIDSLLRGRPVGTLLLMPTNEERFRSRPIKGSGVGMPVTAGGELILDGQQRLTALWRAFHGEPEPLFVQVNGWDCNSLSITAIHTATQAGFRRGVEHSENAVEQHRAGYVPFAVLGIDGITQPADAAWKWCNQAMQNHGERARLLSNRIQLDLAEPLRHRSLWHLALPDEVSRNEAIDIYIKTNESSAVIRRFDIAVAKYDSENNTSLRDEIVHMFDDIGRGKVLIHRFFDTDEEEDGLIPRLGELLFKVCCLWCEFAPTEGKYTHPKVLDMIRRRKNDFRDALIWSLEFYKAEGILQRRFVPSDVPLRVLPSLYPDVKRMRKSEASVLRYVRSYLWRAFLSDRYSQSANTRLHEDYKAMRARLRDATDGKSDWKKGVPIFNDQHYPIPNIDHLAALDDDPLPSPRSRDSLSRAIFAISLREARDFATGQPADSGANQQWDYHHLFPKDYLKKCGFKQAQRNHGLNLALVTARTNSIIRNNPPHEYLAADGPLARAANDVTGQELRQLVESHRIPYTDLVEQPRSSAPHETEVQRLYRAFIKSRAKLIVEAMKALTKGKAALMGD